MFVQRSSGRCGAVGGCDLGHLGNTSHINKGALCAPDLAAFNFDFIVTVKTRKIIAVKVA